MDGDDTRDRRAISDPITIAEAARLLGVHPNTVRNRLKQGVYQFGRVLTPNGEAYVLSRAAIEADARAAGEGPVPSQHAVSLQNVQPGTLQETLPGTLQETLQAVIAPLVEAHAREVAAKDATIERQAEELGTARERARQAEERAAQLELAARRSRQRPWWWRFLAR